MKSKFALSVRACASLLLLFPLWLGTGCAKKVEEVSYLAGPINDDYVESSCAYGFNDGGPAPQQLAENKLVKAYFGKVYDLARIEGVLNSSGSELYRFVQNVDHVRVYRVQTTGRACKNFVSLDIAPEYMLANFLSYGQGLLGLFLSVGTWGQVAEPTIVMREDNDRYTLLHEYFHSVFNRTRLAMGLRPDQDYRVMHRERSDVLAASLNTWNKNDPNFNARVAQQWLNLLDTHMELLRRFLLEEVTIESNLLSFYVQDQIARVTRYNLGNSQVYIRSSWFNAKQTLDKLRPIGKDIAAVLTPAQAALKTKVEEQINAIDAMTTEAEQVVERFAPAPSHEGWDANNALTGLSDGSEGHASPACGHGLGFDPKDLNF